jgi:hypothetical protein
MNNLLVGEKQKNKNKKLKTDKIHRGKKTTNKKVYPKLVKSIQNRAGFTRKREKSKTALNKPGKKTQCPKLGARKNNTSMHWQTTVKCSSENRG